MLPSDVKDIRDLCELLEVEPEIFETIRANRVGLIEERNIMKRRGGVRVVHQITDDSYRNLLRALKRILETRHTFGECVQGFVRGKSTFSNAKLHLAKKIVVNADIKDFFNSISRERVCAVFESIGFAPSMAEILAELSTVDGVLATGFSTSPLLSNLVCRDMDTDFMVLADLHGATYSRYADDLTFSTDGDVPSKEKISDVLVKHGFILNEKKFKMQYKGRSQYVTGLTVSDPYRPHVPRSIKRSLRLETHFIVKYGANSHLNHHSKQGTTPRLIKSPTEHAFGGWMYYVNGIDKKFIQGLTRHLELVAKKRSLEKKLDSEKPL